MVLNNNPIQANEASPPQPHRRLRSNGKRKQVDDDPPFAAPLKHAKTNDKGKNKGKSKSKKDKENIVPATTGASAGQPRLLFSHVEIPPLPSCYPRIAAPLPAFSQPQAPVFQSTGRSQEGILDSNRLQAASPESTPSIGPLPSFLAPCINDGPCRVLAFFGIFRADGFLVCALHKNPFTIVPMSYLAQHLDRQHKCIVRQKWDPSHDVDLDLSKRLRADILAEIAQHVSECVSISLTQTWAQVAGELNIEQPYKVPPGLSTRTRDLSLPKAQDASEEIVMRYKCPSPTCLYWAIYNKGKGASTLELTRHMKKCCVSLIGDARMGAVKIRWMQRLYISTPGSDNHFKFLILPEGWKPGTLAAETQQDTETALSDKQRPVYVYPHTWVTKLGWDRYRASLGPINVELFQSLIVPPSPMLIPDKPSELRYVEEGLIQLRKCTLHYLREANQLVHSHPASLRKALGAGLVESLHFAC